MLTAHSSTSVDKQNTVKSLYKRPQIGFQDQLSLIAGQKNYRMLQGEHSAILWTFIKLPFVVKIFVLYILSGHFTQVLLYIVFKMSSAHVKMAQLIIQL